MDERTRRIGRNEAIFRKVNEQIEQLNERFGAAGDGALRVICECGDLDCADQLTLPAEVYEEVRTDPTWFVLKPGHEIPDVEDVVRRDPDYLVVCKRAGGPEVLDFDPHSA